MDVLKRHGRRGGLGGGGKYRPHSQVSSPGGGGALCLRRRMCAQANMEGRRGNLGDMLESGMEKILLAQVAEIRAAFGRHIGVIIDHQSDSLPCGDCPQLLCDLSHFVPGPALRPPLDEIAPTQAELPAQVLGGPPVQVGGIDKRVETAVRERFRNQAFSSINSRRAPPRSCWTKLVE